MENIKSKIEAILYCIPEGVNVRKLASMLGIGSPGYIKNQLQELKDQYEKEERGFQIINEGSDWKFSVKSEYLELVREAAKPELTSSVLETLAYIAQKGEIKQSDLIKKRTNKAYEHIVELKKLGFIDSEKEGRTKILKLTKKFYDYFQMEEGQSLIP